MVRENRNSCKHVLTGASTYAMIEGEMMSETRIVALIQLWEQEASNAKCQSMFDYYCTRIATAEMILGTDKRFDYRMPGDRIESPSSRMIRDLYQGAKQC